MTDFPKAVKAMHDAAEKYGVSVVALVLEDEEEAIVAASNAKCLLLAQELIEVTVENIPEEFLEDCNCNDENPKENHYLNLLNDSFPELYQTMPEDVKESFKERFDGKSNKAQEAHFEKTFNLLKLMNAILT